MIRTGYGNTPTNKSPNLKQTTSQNKPINSINSNNTNKTNNSTKTTTQINKTTPSQKQQSLTPLSALFTPTSTSYQRKTNNLNQSNQTNISNISKTQINQINTNNINNTNNQINQSKQINSINQNQQKESKVETQRNVYQNLSKNDSQQNVSNSKTNNINNNNNNINNNNTNTINKTLHVTTKFVPSNGKGSIITHTVNLTNQQNQQNQSTNTNSINNPKKTISPTLHCQKQSTNNSINNNSNTSNSSQMKLTNEIASQQTSNVTTTPMMIQTETKSLNQPKSLSKSKSSQKYIVKFQILSCSIDKKLLCHYARILINGKDIKIYIPDQNRPFNSMLNVITTDELPNEFRFIFYSMKHEPIGETVVQLLVNQTITSAYPIKGQNEGSVIIYTSIISQYKEKITSMTFYTNGKVQWKKGNEPLATPCNVKKNSIIPFYADNEYSVFYSEGNSVLQLAMKQPYFHLAYYLIHNQSLPQYTSPHTPSNLVEMIGCTQMIGLVLALLMNKRIILVSQSITTVVFAVAHLLDCIKPIEFPYFCKAPCTINEIDNQPYHLVGIQASAPILRNGTITVDIDKGVIYGSLVQIPYSFTSFLMPCFQYLRNRGDKRYHLIFRWFMAFLLKDVDAFIEYVWIIEAAQPMFDRESWSMTFDSDCFDFLNSFSRTSGFCQFLYRKNDEFSKWINSIKKYSFQQLYLTMQDTSKNMSVQKKRINFSITNNIHKTASTLRTINISNAKNNNTIPHCKNEEQKKPIYLMKELNFLNSPTETSLKIISESIKSRRGRIAVILSFEEIAKTFPLLEQTKFDIYGKIAVELAEQCVKEEEYYLLARLLQVSDRFLLVSGLKLTTKLKKISLKKEVWDILYDIRLIKNKKDLYHNPQEIVLTYDLISNESKTKMRLNEVLRGTHVLKSLIEMMESFGLKKKLIDTLTEELSYCIPPHDLIRIDLNDLDENNDKENDGVV